MYWICVHDGSYINLSRSERIWMVEPSEGFEEDSPRMWGIYVECMGINYRLEEYNSKKLAESYLVVLIHDLNRKGK